MEIKSRPPRRCKGLETAIRYNVQSDSCTKAFTSAALGVLVSEGKLIWTTPVRDLLPGFGNPSDPLDMLLTPLDLLSMRSGHSMLDSMSWQGNNYIFFDKSETNQLFTASPRIVSFRNSFLYNNWGYAVIAVLVEKLSGQKFHVFLKERFFDPLGVQRTEMTDFEHDDNSSLAYAVLDDMTPVEIVIPQIGVDVFMEGGSGILSTVDDMMVIYAKFIEAINDQIKRKTNSTPNNPFKEVPMLIRGHHFRQQHCSRRAILRLRLGSRCTARPIGYDQHESRTHSSTSCDRRLSEQTVYLPPRAYARVLGQHRAAAGNRLVAIVANASPLGDCSDFLSQMILEEIFNSPIRHDYESLAKEASLKVLDHIPTMRRELESLRTPDTNPSLGTKDYTGTYRHTDTSFWVKIAEAGPNLSISFMGVEKETYELRHYEYDTWTWIITYNEAAKRGRFVHYYKADHFLIKFGGVDKGIDQLTWHAVRDTGPESYLLLKSEG